METKSLTQQGNKLKTEFRITHNYDKKRLDVTSPPYICGSFFFQVNVVSIRLMKTGTGYDEVDMLIFVNFVNVNEHDHLRYTCKLSSNTFKSNLSFNIDSIWWYKIHHYNLLRVNTSGAHVYAFDISVDIDTAPTVSQFAGLYEDTALTDFELKGTDGSVKMHKFALASSSPVLKTMLQGKWKETAEGCVNVTGTTKQTLEHFKDYIYLQKLPDSGLEQLLLLSSYYMMPDLIQKCSMKLLNNLNAKNALELIEFAGKYKLNNFVMNILEHIENGAFKVKDMSGYSSWDDTCKETDG